MCICIYIYICIGLLMYLCVVTIISICRAGPGPWWSSSWSAPRPISISTTCVSKIHKRITDSRSYVDCFAGKRGMSAPSS